VVFECFVNILCVDLFFNALTFSFKKKKKKGINLS